MKNFFNQPFVPATLSLGVCVFLGLAVFSYSFYSARGGQGVLSVTGSAKIEIKADSAKWTVSVYRSAYQDGLQNAYLSVAEDAAGVKAYFKQQGIPEASTTQNTVTADQDWSGSQNGPVRYNVHQEITIESSDVDKVQTLSQNVGVFFSRGYSVSPRQPEYYVSTLPDLRVQLLGKAIADAKARAEEIAKSGNTTVGKLQSASSGVVQVLAPNSTNVEDYGSYDTSTVQKEVSVTARASFGVR